MVADRSSQVSVAPELATVLDRWAGGVFSAPRRLSASVTAVESRDEVLHRVLTDVVRRDLREERTFATERQPSPPRIPLSEVDPFVGTFETLKTDTLHIAVCGLCSSTGLVPCQACGGTRVVSCSGCGGAGRFRNPKTNRLNKCKACKASGSVGCGTCDESGRVSCQACRGSGHQRAWLVCTETRTPRVMVHPENSPLAVTHQQLRMPRVLGPRGVGAFTMKTEVHADGPLPLDGLSLESRAVVQRELAALDQRLERVVWQQYMCLAVVRRDVTYQMCGTTGRVEVSGPPLTVGSTREGMQPILRRRMLWPVSVVLLGIGGAILAASAVGKSVYFGPSNDIVSMLWLGATLFSIPWMGGLLRAWRPVVRVRGVRPVEIGFGVMWALMLAAIAIVGVVSRPEAREVDAALVAGDVGRARIVLDALIERESESASLRELEDAVLMAEAEAAEGEDRLAKLDAVSSRDGARASVASARAHAERLAKIRELVRSGRADEAIDAIDHDFAATWSDDPEIAEERAQAEELRAGQCSDDPCRLVARRAAMQAHDTPARTEAVTELRDRLLIALAIERDAAGLAPAERVRTSDEIASLAGQALASNLDDEAIAAAATAAEAWAAGERAAVPILGADLDTLRALFPGIHASSTTMASVSLEGAELFFNLDAKGECRGVYAVGPTRHRELDAPRWSAAAILSQTFGRPVKLVPRTVAGATSNTWKEGKTKIVARWRGRVPIELRIGDARP